MGDQVNVYEAKTRLSRLLERVEAGEEIEALFCGDAPEASPTE